MNPRIRAILIVFFVVLLDRITKVYIRTRVSPFDVHPVIPGFFNIIHTENPGAAFGMLASSDSPLRSWFLIIVSIAVMVIVAWILWNPARAGMGNGPLLQTGLALVLGGALGNFIDRAGRGTVTDFLQFFFGSYEFPSFNVADSAITIGAALLILDMLRSKKEHAK